MTIYENVVAIAIGVVLLVATLLANGISYGMPPHDQKPTYPAIATQSLGCACPL